MAKNLWGKRIVAKVANDMYGDGTSDPERYSEREWKFRGWPEPGPGTYTALRGYLLFLRGVDESRGKEKPKYRRGHIHRRSDG